MIENKKGFTLIELLAVIIILGVLLLLAIPSVTQYIAISRKKTYIGTANKYIDGVVNKVNSLEYQFTDLDTTYYVPIECIPLERGGKSPFGEWVEAYVVVEFMGEKYNYYWVSYDKATMGVNLTEADKLDYNMVIPGIRRIDKEGINGDSKIGVIDKDSCSTTPDIENADSGGSVPAPEPTDESCFAFTPETNTITRYYENQGNNTSNPACPKDVVIPAKINGVDVLHLTNAVGSILGVFYDRNITSVVFPNTLKTIGAYAFYQNKLTGTIRIPKSVTVIGNYSFYGDENSTTNQISNLVVESGGTTLSIGSNAFANNKFTGTLTIPRTVTSIGSNAFVGEASGKTNQIASIICESGCQLHTIDTYAFLANNLTGTLTIPKSVVEIKNGAFMGRQPVGGSNNNNLTGIIFESGSNLQTIGQLSFSYNKLTGTLTIPNSVITIDAYAFEGSTTSNRISNLVFESGAQIQTIGVQAFFQNNLTGTLTIPKSVVTIGRSAFQTNLFTSIVFESDSQLQTIGSEAFFQTPLIGTLTIPKNVTEIGDRAFWGGNSLSPQLTGLVFENGSKLQTIGSEAFAYNRISTVILPSTVTEIGSQAFYMGLLTKVVNTTERAFPWCDSTNGIVYLTDCSPSLPFVTGNLTIGVSRIVNITAN